MKYLFALLAFVFVLYAFAVLEGRTQQPPKNPPGASNWKAVDDAMGRAGQDQPDGIHKYSMPRSDNESDIGQRWFAGRVCVGLLVGISKGR